ncbi:hypothetical protein [Clostridium tagluense]|uniref:Uncharacterized protein n=1 Tax=Clostridium tagluense TaxID=360422 RepID=A0A401UQC8_9CLOT|nr:hypothetical protein [Clostridium tagluense]GCD11739.1 hypothetical protein Ctaglu_33620 [Clostridium tagluense]
MFKDLKVDKTILLSIAVKRAGHNGGAIYASYITVENLDSKECTYKSFNEINKFLDCFEFKSLNRNKPKSIEELNEELCEYCSLEESQNGVHCYGGEPVMCVDSNCCGKAYTNYLEDNK